MADDFALGFLVGIMIILLPEIGIYVWSLRRKIAFLIGDKYPDTGESGSTYDKEYPNRREKT